MTALPRHPVRLAAVCLVCLPAPALQDGGSPAAASGRAGSEQLLALPEPGVPLELSLEQALDVALRRDIGLKLQELAGDVARFSYEGSWGAFDPVVSMDASYTDSETEAFSAFQGTPVIEEQSWRVDSSLLYPLTTGGDITLNYLITETESNNALVQNAQRATTDFISLSFRQPLLRGAGSEYTLSEQREAQLGYRRELATLRLSRLDLLQSVEEAYWDLVAAGSQLAVAQESLALADEQLDQNRRRLEAGVGTEVEVLQSQADIATKREQLLQREVALKDAADVLKMRLYPGINQDAWDTELTPTTELPQIALEQLPPWREAMTIALERRPDLARARLDIEAAEERMIRAQSEQGPQLDFSLTSSSRGFDPSRTQAFEDSFGWEFPSHTVALSFSYPIGNRAARYAERSARADLRSARLQHDDLQANVVSEVRSSHRRVRYEAEVIVAAETSVELARRQLEAERARFREGLATNFQVLEFQEDLTQAQFTLVQARANLAKARAALARAQGVLGENPR